MFSFLAKDILLSIDFCEVSGARNEPTENNQRLLVDSKKK